MKTIRLLVLCAVSLAALGCSKEKAAEEAPAALETGAAETPAAETGTTESDPMETAESGAAAEPDYITVQHILVGFEGSVPGKPITRTKGAAATLAAELLQRAQAGEDFDALVKEYTDDAHPGIYKMSNRGKPADMANGVYPRDQMVPAFGDVGFPLAVGEVGMAPHDAQKSPYGWHIIKRVE